MSKAENLVKVSDPSTLPNSSEVNSTEYDKTSSSGSSDEQSDQEQDMRLQEQSFSFGSSENGFLPPSHMRDLIICRNWGMP
jgi:hypothetical protein